MKVGCCSIKFFLHGNDSLKGKRRIARSIKDRVKNKFNISIAEVGDQDCLRTLHLGVSAVSEDKAHLEGLLDQTVRFIDSMQLAEITDSTIRLVQFNHDEF